MTEQEAKALTARLTRIWEPEIPSWEGRSFSERSLAEFEYRGRLSDGVYLEINFQAPWSESNENYAMYHWDFSLYCSEAGQKYHVIVTNKTLDYSERESLIAPWLPYFRRGCWLSGFPLDASAHEKAEWMQGFTAEELNAWNLKV